MPTPCQHIFAHVSSSAPFVQSSLPPRTPSPTHRLRLPLTTCRCSFASFVLFRGIRFAFARVVIYRSRRKVEQNACDFYFFTSSCWIKEYSNRRDDRQLQKACSCRLDFFVRECVHFIIYCMPANIIHSLTQIHSSYLHFLFVRMEENLFIIIWLFTMTHTVISEMDVSSRCCGEYPSMTLYTLPVHTKPETMLPALSCIAVIHWHGIPPEVLCICSWNVLLLRITYYSV